MRFSLSRRGQNVIEYILLVTALSVLLISWVLVRNGVFVTATNSVLGFPERLIEKEKNRMIVSLPCVPEGCTDKACGSIVKDNCGNDCMGMNCLNNPGGTVCLEDAPTKIFCSPASSACHCGWP